MAIEMILAGRVYGLQRIDTTEHPGIEAKVLRPTWNASRHRTTWDKIRDLVEKTGRRNIAVVNGAESSIVRIYRNSWSFIKRPFVPMSPDLWNCAMRGGETLIVHAAIVAHDELDVRFYTDAEVEAILADQP